MLDKQSETWEAVVKFIDTELAAVSRKLASKTSDYSDTMFNRGYLAALVSLKELPDKAEIPPLTTDDYFN